MQNELNALKPNGTWTFTILPPHRKVACCIWVFKTKENVDISIQKHKARLVVKGYHQEQGFDFIKTFTPVVKPTIIKVILTLATTYEWDIQLVDVNNAILDGSLNQEIYMIQITSFVSFDKTLMCKLHKAIYGLKKAPTVWFEKQTHVLLHLGSLHLNATSLFLSTVSNAYLFMSLFLLMAY